MSKPVIKKSELVSLINDKGYTRKELAEHFNVSVAEINKYLKVLNLKLRAKKMTYEIVDDTVIVDNVSAAVAEEVQPMNPIIA
jgi:transcriptional regulator with XRE-family HTH domain